MRPRPLLKVNLDLQPSLVIEETKRHVNVRCIQGQDIVYLHPKVKTTLSKSSMLEVHFIKYA